MKDVHVSMPKDEKFDIRKEYIELQKLYEDQIHYISDQKQEIARQIIRVKYAKQRGALLFFIGLIGGILGVYLMSLIF